MENQIPQLNPTQAYAVKLFDGVFSADVISNKRSTVFYRIANFRSPKTQRAISEVLTQDQIGEVINELDSLQFNRSIASRVARAGEVPEEF